MYAGGQKNTAGIGGVGGLTLVGGKFKKKPRSAAFFDGIAKCYLRELLLIVSTSSAAT